jgi:hypothetical protein
VWTEESVKVVSADINGTRSITQFKVHRMQLATNEIVTLVDEGPIYPNFPEFFLHLSNKRMYWQNESSSIFSMGYDGGNLKAFRNGLFNDFLLGKFEDSVYFRKENVRYINEINLASGNLSRRNKIDKAESSNLVFVHTSVQPMGEWQTLWQHYTDIIRVRQIIIRKAKKITMTPIYGGKFSFILATFHVDNALWKIFVN